MIGGVTGGIINGDIACINSGPGTLAGVVSRTQLCRSAIRGARPRDNAKSRESERRR